MRKFFSILFAFFILLAGMNLTVAVHYCGGSIVATTLSFNGEPASCGMESDAECPKKTESGFDSNCCKNEFTVYSVDNNFAPSEYHFTKLTQNVVQDLSVIEIISLQHKYSHFSNFATVSPPCSHAASAVCMADICVFRI